MKVRSYLILTALAILVPVIIFAAVALNMLLGAERQAALRGLHETARATALIVDRELSSAEAALRVLAKSRNLETGDLEKFYEQAKSADRGPQAWTQLLDSNGQQLVNTLVPFGTKLPPPVAGERVRQVLASQKTLVSELALGAVSKKLVTTVNVPAPVGGKQYVVSETFSADYFQRVLNQSQIPASWIVGIIDRNGKFIARSHKSHDLVGKDARPELVQAASKGVQGMIRHQTLEGIEAYDVFTHSQISGWTVAVAAPVNLIEGSARQAVMVAALGLLAAILCAGAAAVYYGRRLERAVAGVTQSAVMLGRDHPPVAASSGVDEVDRLHAALRDASEVLRQGEQERALWLESALVARQTAEAQNNAKDKFLAMLGHELRNPLSAISGAIMVAGLEAATPEMVRRAQEIIERQAGHLVRIVDDLLDAGRIMKGNIPLTLVPLDLGHAVLACVEGLRATGRNKNHDLHIHTVTAWIDADPTRMEQIINNLIINALKYTPEQGRIDVSMSCTRSEATLTVADTGIGISSDLLPHVFDAFVQGPTSLDRSEGGLGIGLTLVRELVALHGGSVQASSDGPGCGSRFTVHLPLRQGSIAEDRTDATIPTVLPCKILLIDDNDDARLMMSTVLMDDGFDVLEAAFGYAGLQMAQREQPSVAVVDIGLPDMNGYEIARRLRADPATVSIGLIALTGYGQDSDRERALTAGFDVHLVKPINKQDLMAAIEQVRAQAPV